MSENSLNLAPNSSRRPVGWAVVLGVVLLVIGTFVASTGVITGLLVFNGCFGASGPVGEVLAMAWIFGVWPISVLATALLPPVLLGTGRGGKKAAIAFFVGCLVSVLVWLAWLGIGYLTMC